MALFGRETEEDRQRAQAYGRWVQQRNPFAIASVVVGTFSLIEFGAIPIFSLVAVFLGITGLRQLNRPNPPQPLGRRLAWAGIALGGVALVSGAILYTLRFMHR